MSSKIARPRALFALLGILVLALALAACGSDDSSTDTSASTTGGGGGETTGTLIKSNPANSKVTLKIGSKNFTEQIILGEIYAQALQAAGYNVKKDLNLGSETIALQTLKSGEISGYPEYISTALTSFFDVAPEDVPASPEEGAKQANQEFEKEGLTSFAPTPFASANAVGMLATEADKLGVTKVSQLKGKVGDLTLYGSPECRQRVDCLVGLEQNGIDFGKFVPVDIALRYDVLDKGQADASILFTTDAQLAAEKDKYVILEDDLGIFPAGNVVFVTDKGTVQKAGPDYQKTIEAVQKGLTIPVMQELDARVDIDHQTPAAVAAEYLSEDGYTK